MAISALFFVFLGTMPRFAPLCKKKPGMADTPSYLWFIYEKT